MQTTLTLVAALALGAPAIKDKEKLGKGPGYLGVMFQAEAEGMVISEIKDDGPSGKAGLKVGDVITKIDDTSLAGGNTNDLIKVVSAKRPGMTVALTVKRDNETLTVKVKLAARPANFVQQPQFPTEPPPMFGD